MAKIKYLGSADVREIEKGETFAGRLAEATTKTLRFDRSNNFVIDTEEAGLSEDAVALLLTDDQFKDVTDAKRIPLSLNEKIFHGLSDADEDDVAGPVQTEAVTGKKSGSAPAGSGRGGGTTTTVGGSTAGGGDSA